MREGREEKGGVGTKGRKGEEGGECTHFYVSFGCCFWRVVFGVHSVNLDAHLSPLVVLVSV